MDSDTIKLNRDDNTRKSLRTRKGLAPSPPKTEEELLEDVQLRRQGGGNNVTSGSNIIRPAGAAMSLMLPKQATLAVEEDDNDVSFALGSIEKHINQVEESFKHLKHQDSQASIDELQVELIRKSKRYCETENLLHPCASDMASEHDFGYLRGNADLQASDIELKPQDFQRNTDARSSMGANYKTAVGGGSGVGGNGGINISQRPKIARTASDTKNTDVLAMRAIIKQKQQQQQQQQQNIPTISTKENIITSSTTTTTTTTTATPSPSPSQSSNNTNTTSTTSAMINNNNKNSSNNNNNNNNNNSSIVTSTGKRISQRTREENLKQFEALLAAHRASRLASTNTNNNTVAPTTTNIIRPPNDTVKVNIPPQTTAAHNIVSANNAAGATTTTTTNKPQIISPSSSHWTPPLVIGNRNNRYANTVTQVKHKHNNFFFLCYKNKNIHKTQKTDQLQCVPNNSGTIV